MGVVCQGWGWGMHAFGLDGGQANQCSVGVVGVMSGVGVCVWDPSVEFCVYWMGRCRCYALELLQIKYG